MAKLELQNAYRSVKIHPSNYAATGLKSKFSKDSNVTYMVDTRLPFGASQSPNTFHRLTQAVREIMRKKGYDTIIVYLDDFLIVGSTYQECQEALFALMKLVRELGFQINYNKVEGPTQKLTFLGLELNSTSMTISIPQGKLQDTEKL